MKSPNARPPERPRVLLVEDDDAVRRALQLLLVARGYDVRAYRSGEGLATDAEALRATCLVADLVIPGGDALSLLADLKAAGWSGAAILVSGHLTDDLAARALDQGYDLVLPKPIGEYRLVNSIAQLLAEPRYFPTST